MIRKPCRRARHGAFGRVWISDRGMASAKNLTWLRETGRRYIIGAPKAELKQFAAQLTDPNGWHSVRDGVEVKLTSHPTTGETAILCRSEDRRTKERAMHDKFSQRSAARYTVTLQPDNCAAGFRLGVVCDETLDSWAQISEGAYLLRSNISDWNNEQLWKAYIQLTQAEAAFRIQKDQLKLRPVWHQREDSVQAHNLVCFLAFVLCTCLE